MIKSIIRYLTNFPFYPHWLEFYKQERGNNYILKNLKGKVIEVGAGDGYRKYQLINKHKKIKEYISTDYSSWDNKFEKIDTKVKNFRGLPAEIFKIKERLPVDKRCSALDLPYNDDTFDYHLSFEVLEHIDNPYKFFNEASRVLKKGGYIGLSVPFLYRIHGGEPDHDLDYFRYANGFFNRVAQLNNIKLLKVHSNTGFGTTFASLTNQWLIRRILRSHIILKIFLLTFSPLVFFLTNTIGFIIDLKPDKDFATRLHVIMQKQ